MDLTPERRAELAALFDDDGAALEARYPQLADYFRTTSQFASSADPTGDAAFDIRLLHYMTGGESDNPYWDIVAPAVSRSDESGRRKVSSGTPGGSARLRYAQGLLQATFAYPIPSPETLQWMAANAEGRPVLEIGAGRGYWAQQLARHGVHVAAYDSHPPGDHTRNTWFPPIAGQPHVWHPVGDLRDLAVARRTMTQTGTCEHVLFLCWPPSWGHPMASRALTAYERAGGDTVLYIGEPQGGRCGDDMFFESLIARWRLSEREPHHVSWWNLNDVAECWTRTP